MKQFNWQGHTYTYNNGEVTNEHGVLLFIDGEMGDYLHIDNPDGTFTTVSYDMVRLMKQFIDLKEKGSLRK